MTFGENRTQNVPEVMELTKILKVFLESQRGKGWPNLYRLLRGGSHGNGEKSFKNCVDLWGKVAWRIHQSV